MVIKCLGLSDFRVSNIAYHWLIVFTKILTNTISPYNFVVNSPTNNINLFCNIKRQQQYQTTHRENQSTVERTNRIKLQLRYQTAHFENQCAADRTDCLKRQLDHEIARNGNESKARHISIYFLFYCNTNNKFHNSARSAPAWEIHDNIFEVHSLGSMTFPCSHCSAKFWQSEKLSTSTKDCFRCGGSTASMLTPRSSSENLGLTIFKGINCIYNISGQNIQKFRNSIYLYTY